MTWAPARIPTSDTPSPSHSCDLLPPPPTLLSVVMHPLVRAAWDGAVAKPLEAASAAEAAAEAPQPPAAAGSCGGCSGSTSGRVMLAEWGRGQLQRLLSRIMIRSCKADLALLPPCYKKVGAAWVWANWVLWGGRVQCCQSACSSVTGTCVRGCGCGEVRHCYKKVRVGCQ
jgi:hypothetical protein